MARFQQASNPSRSLLPAGWHYPDAEEAGRLLAELGRELPPGHLLDGVAVEIFARADGNDDMLFCHRDHPARFVVVHLSWLGRTEMDARHPAVEFTGSFAEFLAEQERLHGLVPPGPPRRPTG